MQVSANIPSFPVFILFVLIPFPLLSSLSHICCGDLVSSWKDEMDGSFPKLYVDDSIGGSAEQQTSFFNTAKCKVIHLGMKIVGHIYIR